MFTVRCDCMTSIDVDPAHLNRLLKCPECGREIVCVSAEPLDDASAALDFDAGLIVAAGPSRQNQMIRLGGSVAINIGSGKDNYIVLPGDGVAPAHARLFRIDFNPVVWQIDDVSDGAGVLVNGERTLSCELQDGDLLQIGEYALRYQVARASQASAPELQKEALVAHAAETGQSVDAPKTAARPVIASAPASRRDGPTCPSCRRHLARGAKICVDCGIHIRSGRPLLTSQGLDENTVYGNAETAVRIASWLLWLSPLPIPLASAAYGKFRPIAMMSIAALTFGISIWMLVVAWSGNSATPQQLMLWPAKTDYAKILNQQMQERERRHQSGATIANLANDLEYSDEKYRAQQDKENRGHQFHVWQLVTYPAVQESGSLFRFIVLLAGNMLFLVVFGTRVNAIIGNLLSLIFYPLFAIVAGVTFLLTMPPDRLSPLSGASGAIAGLAGMYLVLFPAHQVYCGVWARFGTYFAMKVFALRGFWILLLYVAFDVLVAFLGSDAHAVHWAQLAGFAAGIVAALALLISRKFNCSNGDLLSVVLGKYAWPLIGKPRQWETSNAIPAAHAGVSQ